MKLEWFDNDKRMDATEVKWLKNQTYCNCPPAKPQKRWKDILDTDSANFLRIPNWRVQSADPKSESGISSLEANCVVISSQVSKPPSLVKHSTQYKFIHDFYRPYRIWSTTAWSAVNSGILFRICPEGGAHMDLKRGHYTVVVHLHLSIFNTRPRRIGISDPSHFHNPSIIHSSLISGKR